MSPFFLISEPFQYTKGSGKGFSNVVTGQFSARLRRAHVLVRKVLRACRQNLPHKHEKGSFTSQAKSMEALYKGPAQIDYKL